MKNSEIERLRKLEPNGLIKEFLKNKKPFKMMTSYFCEEDGFFHVMLVVVDDNDDDVIIEAQISIMTDEKRKPGVNVWDLSIHRGEVKH